MNSGSGTRKSGGGRQLVVGIILGTIILAGSAMICYELVGRKALQNQSEKPQIYLYCTACGATYQPEKRLGGKHPRVCEKCGEKAAWYAQLCLDCEEVFPLKPMIDREGNPMPGPPLCPKCGSGRYVFYKPGLLSRENKEGSDE